MANNHQLLDDISFPPLSQRRSTQYNPPTTANVIGGKHLCQNTDPILATDVGSDADANDHTPSKTTIGPTSSGAKCNIPNATTIQLNNARTTANRLNNIAIKPNYRHPTTVSLTTDKPSTCRNATNILAATVGSSHHSPVASLLLFTACDRRNHCHYKPPLLASHHEQPPSP